MTGSSHIAATALAAQLQGLLEVCPTLAPLVPLVSPDHSDVSSAHLKEKWGERLATVAAVAASCHPEAGASLLTKAHHIERLGEGFFYRRWRDFNRTLEGKTALLADPSRLQEYLESPEDMTSMVMALRDHTRRGAWIREGLDRLGINADVSVLNDLLDFENRVICFDLKRSPERGGPIQISWQKKPSEQIYTISLTLSQDAPKLSREKLHALTVQALLLEAFGPFLSQAAREQLGRASTTENHVHLPLFILSPSGAFNLSEGRIAGGSAIDVVKLLEGIEQITRLADHVRYSARSHEVRHDKSLGNRSQHLLEIGDAFPLFVQKITAIVPRPVVFVIQFNASFGPWIRLEKKRVSSNHTILSLSLTKAAFQQLTLSDYCQLIALSDDLQETSVPSKELHEGVGSFAVKSLFTRTGQGSFYWDLTLRDLEEAQRLAPERRQLVPSLEIISEYYDMRSRRRDPEVIHIEGSASSTVKDALGNALQAVELFLHTQGLPEGDPLSLVWSHITDVYRWGVFHDGLTNGDTSLLIIPIGYEVRFLVSGPIEKMTPADWLWVLCVLISRPGQVIAAFPTLRTLSKTTANPNHESFYRAIASQRIYQGLGVYDPKISVVSGPAKLAVELPGGIPVTANPNFGDMSFEERQAYLRALVWFATSGVRESWQPWASDDLKTIRHKYNKMNIALHPDHGGGEADVVLLMASREHWKVVRKGHEPHKNMSAGEMT